VGKTPEIQGRYVMRHPWRGTATCPAAEKYRASLPARFRQEAENLSGLTGWDAKDIAARMEAAGAVITSEKRCGFRFFAVRARRVLTCSS